MRAPVLAAGGESPVDMRAAVVGSDRVDRTPARRVAPRPAARGTLDA